MRILGATLLWIVASHSINAQVAAPEGTPASFSVSRADAGPARTELGYGIVVNKGSALHRQAHTVHDARIRAQISGDAIVHTVYADREYSYKASLAVMPTENLAAVEVRFILFDVLGGRMKVLSSTDVTDLIAGTPKTLGASWNAWAVCIKWCNSAVS